MGIKEQGLEGEVMILVCLPEKEQDFCRDRGRK